MLIYRKQLDTSGKSPAYCHHRKKRRRPMRLDGRCLRGGSKNPNRQLTLHRFAASEALAGGWRPALSQGHLDMQTAPTSAETSPIASPERGQGMPRIKLSRRGVSIDHPDQDAGERLMAAALGVADRDAMYGILRQLVKASVIRQRPDAANLAFMISMMENLKPRDATEAMLVAQMVAVHVAAMRCAQQLGSAEDMAGKESAARALTRLARTFPAQIDALNRHRNASEPAITVQNLSVQDGGKAIVGNVTQHASLTFADARPAPESGNRAHAALHATAGDA